MTQMLIDMEDTPILVEFSSRGGMREVNALDQSVEKLTDLSQKAVDKAVGTVKQMAARLLAIQDSLPAELTQIEVGFGIKFDVEIGAVISKAGGEAALNVTMTWERSKAQKSEDLAPGT